MAANQCGSFPYLPLVSLNPEAEVHGVEVDREERVTAVGECIKGDTGGLGCCQRGFRLQQLKVH